MLQLCIPMENNKSSSRQYGQQSLIDFAHWGMIKSMPPLNGMNKRQKPEWVLTEWTYSLFPSGLELSGTRAKQRPGFLPKWCHFQRGNTTGKGGAGREGGWEGELAFEGTNDFTACALLSTHARAHTGWAWKSKTAVYLPPNSHFKIKRRTGNNKKKNL